MSRKRRKEQERIKGGFVPFLYSMMDSAAYKSLSGNASKALPYFFRKVKTNGADRFTTKFEFSYKEAQKSGFPQSSFNNILKELIEAGFIDRIEAGGLRNEGKSCSIYRLSKRWENFGTADFINHRKGQAESINGR